MQADSQFSADRAQYFFQFGSGVYGDDGFGADAFCVYGFCLHGQAVANEPEAYRGD